METALNKPDQTIILRRCGNGGWLVLDGDTIGTRNEPVRMGAYSNTSDMIQEINILIADLEGTLNSKEESNV